MATCLQARAMPAAVPHINSNKIGLDELNRPPRSSVPLGAPYDHLHSHPQAFLCLAEPCTGKRNSLSWVSSDGDSDQVVAADDAVGRIELDPAGARQINLAP